MTELIKRTGSTRVYPAIASGCETVTTIEGVSYKCLARNGIRGVNIEDQIVLLADGTVRSDVLGVIYHVEVITKDPNHGVFPALAGAGVTMFHDGTRWFRGTSCNGHAVKGHNVNDSVTVDDAGFRSKILGQIEVAVEHE